MKIFHTCNVCAPDVDRANKFGMVMYRDQTKNFRDGALQIPYFSNIQLPCK